jgi:hypothetical protein
MTDSDLCLVSIEMSHAWSAPSRMSGQVIRDTGVRSPYAPQFNIRQLTDVLHCKLQQAYLYRLGTASGSG